MIHLATETKVQAIDRKTGSLKATVYPNKDNNDLLFYFNYNGEKKWAFYSLLHKKHPHYIKYEERDFNNLTQKDMLELNKWYRKVINDDVTTYTDLEKSLPEAIKIDIEKYEYKLEGFLTKIIDVRHWLSQAIYQEYLRKEYCKEFSIYSAKPEVKTIDDEEHIIYYWLLTREQEQLEITEDYISRDDAKKIISMSLSYVNEDKRFELTLPGDIDDLNFYDYDLHDQFTSILKNILKHKGKMLKMTSIKDIK